MNGLCKQALEKTSQLDFKSDHSLYLSLNILYMVYFSISFRGNVVQNIELFMTVKFYIFDMLPLVG